MPTVIYALLDPRKGTVRYVGKTVGTLAKRLCSHISSTRRALRGKSSLLYVGRWIAGLLSAGLKPMIAELEVVPAGQNWVVAEQKWIAHYLGIGAKLTNGTAGGEGVIGHRHSGATRARLSATTKQFMCTPEQRMRASNRIQWRKLSDRQAFEIVQSYVRAGGKLKQPDLAREYGVRQSAISNLICGRTFRHVISPEIRQQALAISRLQNSKAKESDILKAIERYVEGGDVPPDLSSS